MGMGGLSYRKDECTGATQFIKNLVDTPHFMSEIWKYRLRVAVLFETIHHEGFCD